MWSPGVGSTLTQLSVCVTEQASFSVDVSLFVHGSISLMDGGFSHARRRSRLFGRRVVGRQIGGWPGRRVPGRVQGPGLKRGRSVGLSASPGREVTAADPMPSDAVATRQFAVTLHLKALTASGFSSEWHILFLIRRNCNYKCTIYNTPFLALQVSHAFATRLRI